MIIDILDLPVPEPKPRQTGRAAAASDQRLAANHFGTGGGNPEISCMHAAADGFEHYTRKSTFDCRSSARSRPALDESGGGKALQKEKMCRAKGPAT